MLLILHFYANVAKKWEGRRGRVYFIPVNGCWGDRGLGQGKHTVCMETLSFDVSAKSGGKQTLER